MKMVNHRLVRIRLPPFRREILLAAGDDDPEMFGHTGRAAGRRRFFLGQRQVDVAAETAHRYAHAQAFFQVLDVTMEEVIGPLVRLMNERVMHVEHADAGLAFLDSGYMWVVLPQGRRRGADVGLEPAGRGLVQVADGGREHDNVARALKRAQDQPLHGRCLFRGSE